MQKIAMVITGGTQQLEYEIKKNGKSWINKIERFSNDCEEINTKVITGQPKAVKRAMFNQNSDVQFGITCIPAQSTGRNRACKERLVLVLIG